MKFISKGILHNDIHSGNIMIDKSHTPKLIDFGNACYENNCRFPDSSRENDTSLLETLYMKH